MRKEFEKLPEIAEIIKEGMFWDGEIYRRTAICKLTHLYYVRGAWYAWQAKAQAVPKGFVVVKTSAIAKLAIAVSRVDLMTYSEARPDSEKLAWQNVANKLEAMIKAQEQSHE